jgi:hypothetical protein
VTHQGKELEPYSCRIGILFPIYDKEMLAIMYALSKLRGPELLYTIYDKEMLAIMYALSKFIQYFVGVKFVVIIDHNNLKYFLEQKDLNERQ